jgi:hypothetical protein
MSPLSKGDRLLSLPSDRPTITLSASITIQADGPAQFELVGWTEAQVPILQVDFGRLLMLTVGKPGNSLQLRLDGQEAMLTFVDAESMLALDVHRELPAGEDPERAPAPLVATVYATSGLVRVQQGDGEPVELTSPARRTLAGPAEPEAAPFPAWVTNEAQNEFDRRATAELEPNLKPDRPLAIQIKELLADPLHPVTRRREAKSLAVRSLATLGDYAPCVAAFNESKERLFWPTARDELQAAIARSPETAARVRAEFEKQRGAQAGGGLYRTLWGYSQVDLGDGAHKELVEGLMNESLDHRVLSFLALQQLTGATHGYRPDGNELARRTAYNTWKKQKLGKVAPRASSNTAKDKGSPRGE